MQRREGPWLSPIICKTLVAYYNEVELTLPEPSFGPTTDLEVNAPIGAYALCTVAICIQPYSLPCLPFELTIFTGTTCSVHLLHWWICCHQGEIRRLQIWKDYKKDHQLAPGAGLPDMELNLCSARANWGGYEEAFKESTRCSSGSSWGWFRWWAGGAPIERTGLGSHSYCLVPRNRMNNLFLDFAFRLNFAFH